MSCPSREEFQVGWICALPIEAAAAKEMLDENFGVLEEQDVTDPNIYTLGRIGKHYVVIACLPAGQYGTTSATTVANNMVRTFSTSLRVGLMVGVGGGIPSTLHDIRLGDVVISCPTGTCGGVIQYDMGKVGIDGTFSRTGSLNSPPRSLLTAVNAMRAAELTDDPLYPAYLQSAIERTARTRKTFARPNPRTDRLFQSKYDHPGNADNCYACPEEWEETRAEREDRDPRPHYGTIASGNAVIKHGWTREKLRLETGALCFEMEAAGLLFDFPCIVIRGISDYSDSHKNKQWQGYAALAAASYTKEMLGYIPRGQVSQENLATDVCLCVLDALDECHQDDQLELIQRVKCFVSPVGSTTQGTWLKFLLTSRPYDEIKNKFQAITDSFPHIHLQGEQENDQIRKEIDLVIKIKVTSLAKTTQLSLDVQQRIQHQLLRMEHRTYLWLYLAIDDIRTTFQDRLRPADETIQLIPPSVHAAYEKILSRVPSNRAHEVRMILQIIVGARRPLTLDEMAMALGIALLPESRTAASAKIDPGQLGQKIRRLCGLFVFINNSKILLEKGADVDAQGGLYGNALQAASYGGYDKIVQILLEKGANINAQGGEYENALQAASYRGLERIIQILLEKEANVNAQGGFYGNALHAASYRGHDSVVQILLQRGADINAQGGKYGNPLQAASYGGHERITQILLENGADVNAQHAELGNALQAASYGGHDSVVQILLEKGAHLNAQGGFYGNALQAASCGGHDKIVQILLEKGANVNAQGGFYRNALQAASYGGHDKIVQILLENGANVMLGVESMGMPSRQLLMEGMTRLYRFCWRKELMFMLRVDSMGMPSTLLLMQAWHIWLFLLK
ncbi:hypothetical protein CNMCM7691_002751 [Aspergillus felis]|uniref:Nucleoside phosphorylase domain-containing protein n=1 Tax=Aspergillus felis TaxID=1287682 RepID=A0A8H6R3G9_9EURO|nr:hypothetical protein CNMCM7691_002751 [Aspergillus felis]